MEKRGRGRPKGSKNKESRTTTTTANDDPISNIKTPNDVAGKKLKGRGSMNPNTGPRMYAKTTQHVYTELAKTALSNTDLYNLYGIVVDASSPSRNEKGIRIQLRIIDPSIQASR